MAEIVGIAVVAWFLNAILIQPIATFAFNANFSTYPLAVVLTLVSQFIA
jgi:hypothetical protein